MKDDESGFCVGHARRHCPEIKGLSHLQLYQFEN